MDAMRKRGLRFLSNSYSTISYWYGLSIVSSADCSGGCKGTIQRWFYSSGTHLWILGASPAYTGGNYTYSTGGFLGLSPGIVNDILRKQRPAL